MNVVSEPVATATGYRTHSLTGSNLPLRTLLAMSADDWRRRARDSVNTNRRMFDRFADEAALALARGAYRQGIGLAEISFSIAWQMHSGFFSHPALEEALVRASDAIPDRGGQTRGITTRPSSPTQRRVLHVATKFYAAGGHASVLRRWIGTDLASTHNLVLTDADSTVPISLEQAVHSSGGMIERVAPESAGIPSAVARLRQLGAEHDVVVLHIHPYDVTPLLAFAEHRSPTPVLLLNHVDHAFWAGCLAASVVTNMRTAALELNVRRRAIPADANQLLPVPLDECRPYDPSARESVRTRLGVHHTDVLIVSAASPYKFERAPGNLHFSRLFDKLGSPSNVRFVVVGPPADGVWADAERSTGGHMRAIGMQPDVADLLAAADLYVDSYPVGSMTSLLEAVSTGVPAISFCAVPPDAATLCARGLELGIGHTIVDDESELVAELQDMIRESNSKRPRQASSVEWISSRHTGDGWRRECEKVYELASGRAGRRIRFNPLPGPSPVSDLDLMLTNLGVADSDAAPAVANGIRLMPYRARVDLLYEFPESRGFRQDWSLGERLVARFARLRRKAPGRHVDRHT